MTRARWLIALVLINGFMSLLLVNAPLRAQTDATPPPTNTRHPTPTNVPTMPTLAAPTLAATFIASPAGLIGGDLASWTPQPISAQMAAYQEHFVFSRPIGSDAVNYPARNYAYGSMDGGGRPVHHGDDFQNPLGTPILAAADGVVDYAGDDIRVMYGPMPNFYGNVIVIRHSFVDSSGQPVYTLYGHLSQIGVRTGQAVQQGSIIGLVGSAGVAVGAHLHFEVRVGTPTSYNATRNPELWVTPFSTYGAIAGRVTDLNGQPVHSAVVEMQNGSSYRSAETYGDNNVNGDSQLGENFATSDLPGGYYLVFIKSADGALLYRNTVLVTANKVSWLDIHIAS